MGIKLKEGSSSPTTRRMVPVIEMTLWTARRKRKYQGSNLARERDGKRPSHVPGSSGGDVSDSDYEQRASSSPRAGKRVKSEDDSDYGVKKSMQRRSVEVTVKDEEVDFKFKVEDHEQDVKAEVKDEAEVDFKFKVEDHEQKQQGAKAEVKDEEADFKSKVEEHEQNEQDVKSPGGEKKGLNPDAKRVTLPQLPPYVIPGSIPRELLSTCVTRPALTWGFGAAVQFSQIRLTFLDGTPDIDALALHTKHNPELPRAPGRHGIYLSACPRAADEVPTPIFVCDGMHQWGYRGHFVKSPSAPMLAPVWRLQSKRFRRIWLKDLYGGGQEVFYWFRAATYLKLNKIPVNQTSLVARLKHEVVVHDTLLLLKRSGAITQAELQSRRDHETGITFENLEFALSSGLMVKYSQLSDLNKTGRDLLQTLYSIILRCVDYDMAFQQLLADTVRDWTELGKPRKTRPEVAEIKRARQKLRGGLKVKEETPAVELES